MLKYKLIKNSTSILRNLDGATIPNDTNNKDWITYQEWLNNDNIPEPFDIPNVPIAEIKLRNEFSTFEIVIAILDEIKTEDNEKFREIKQRLIELRNKKLLL